MAIDWNCSSNWTCSTDRWYQKGLQSIDEYWRNEMQRKGNPKEGTAERKSCWWAMQAVLIGPHLNGGKTTQNWTRAKKQEEPLKSGGKHYSHYGFLQVLTQFFTNPLISALISALNLACRPKAWIRAVPHGWNGYWGGSSHSKTAWLVHKPVV